MSIQDDNLIQPDLNELQKQRREEDEQQERKRRQHQQDAYVDYLQANMAKGVELNEKLIQEKVAAPTPKKRFNWSLLFLLINVLCVGLIWLDFVYKLLPGYTSIGLAVGSVICWILQILTTRN